LSFWSILIYFQVLNINSYINIDEDHIFKDWLEKQTINLKLENLYTNGPKRQNIAMKRR